LNNRRLAFAFAYAAGQTNSENQRADYNKQFFHAVPRSRITVQVSPPLDLQLVELLIPPPCPRRNMRVIGPNWFAVGNPLSAVRKSLVNGAPAYGPSLRSRHRIILVANGA
jgi:hypothetical protein